jgi:regulator of replication initiation timing
MNDLNNSIVELKLKIESLIESHKILKEENSVLKSENESLKLKLTEQENKIETIQQEQELLIQNKSEEQHKVITDSKLKIDELVQEIDNCLALLK